MRGPLASLPHIIASALGSGSRRFGGIRCLLLPLLLTARRLHELVACVIRPGRSELASARTFGWERAALFRPSRWSGTGLPRRPTTGTVSSPTSAGPETGLTWPITRRWSGAARPMLDAQSILRGTGII